jgi:phospholipid/cholesterol/gamma-HCH transport system substrate-binding protein
MRINILEVAVGFFVVVGMAAFLFLAVEVSGVSMKYNEAEQYKLYADFANASGLSPRAKVTIAGVTVGRVQTVMIDKINHKAKVEMLINHDIDFIPIDTIASIQTAGVLGEKYISLSLGVEEEMLVDDGNISDTQSSLVLEELIGKFMSSAMAKP